LRWINSAPGNRHSAIFSLIWSRSTANSSLNIDSDPANQILIGALVAMARAFDMVTVAVGVETRTEAEYLAAIGVDCLQGFVFGAPSIRPPWLPPC